ncbi:MAG: hypothetical protein ACKD6N_03215 [Candidatus Bathyarchaeota archaeon]
MVVVGRKSIKLPFIGKEKFIELMKVGLGYDHATKTFYIQNLSYIDRLKATLSEIFNDEVIFAQVCLICGRVFPCSDCEFFNECKSNNYPSYCICKSCMEKPNLFTLYVSKSKKFIGYG